MANIGKPGGAVTLIAGLLIMGFGIAGDAAGIKIPGLASGSIFALGTIPTAFGLGALLSE